MNSAHMQVSDASEPTQALAEMQQTHEQFKENNIIMGKYHGFTNRFEKFFSSDQGQKLLNYAYGFGAAIVLLGALFIL